MSALTARRVATLIAPGLYGDGGNLYLQVRGPGRRSWLFRYTIAGKAQSMGLGPAEDVSLAEARDQAEAARKLLRGGIDPREHRDAARAAAIAASAGRITFAEVMEDYLAAHEQGWHSARHGAIWRASMVQHVLPMIGAMPVATIATDTVLKILHPLWTTKTETASRLRGRIESVLSYAAAHGWREGPNPAVWRGHLQMMLARKNRVKPVTHHPALDWREAPAFMTALRALDTNHPGEGLGVPGADRCPLRRSSRRDLARDRSRKRGVDHSHRAHEGAAPAPCAVIASRRGRVGISGAAAPPRRCRIPRPTAVPADVRRDPGPAAAYAGPR
jgi:hypothetical protein